MSTRSSGVGPSSTSVYAPRDTPARGPLGRAFEHRELLAGEEQRGRAGAVEVDAPRAAHLVGVGGTDHPQTGHRAQCRELLDRLVGRAVFTDADGVVRPHERDLGAHDRGEPDRGPHVVAEHEERADRRQEPTPPCRSPTAPMPCSWMP